MPPKTSTTRTSGGNSAATLAKVPSLAGVDKSVLSPKYLLNSPPSQLLNALCDTYATLDILSTTELTTGTVPALAHYSADFLAELAKSEYLANPSPDVQVMSACCLACVLGGGPPTVLARGIGAPIPSQYTDSQCFEILKLMVGTIHLLRTATGKSSYHSYIRQLLEKLTARHIMHSLLQRLRNGGGGNDDQIRTSPPPSPAPKKQKGAASDGAVNAAEIDELLDQLFDAVLNITATDEGMVSHMATLLGDVIAATRSVTDAQMNFLLSSLVSKGGDAGSGSRVSQAVLRRNEDVMHVSVAEHLQHRLDLQLEEFIAADISASGAPSAEDEAFKERKDALRKFAGTLEICATVCGVSVNLVAQLIPGMQRYFDHDHQDIRLVLVRIFSRIFVANPALTTSYVPAYHAFLGRFHDLRVPIRIELIKYGRDALLKAPLSDRLWAALSQLFAQKLVDTDESVRRAAVGAVVDVALVAPRRVPNRLYEYLASRCKDKHAKVRQTAIERLSELYQNTRLAWIPNAIFSSAAISHGGDISLVEYAIFDMLPKPTVAASPAVTGTRKKQATLSKAGAVVPMKRKGSNFDFEGDSKGEDSKQSIDPTMMGAFVQMCGALDAISWDIMQQLMNKKRNLRLAVRRLLEIGDMMRRKENMEVATANARRLIDFISNITHARDEVSHIFVEKDKTTLNALADVCKPLCLDFLKADDALLSKSKGFIHNFLKNNLCKRLYLAFSTEDVKSLVALITNQRRAATGSSDTKTLTERLGAMRALEALSLMAPQLLLEPATMALTTWIKEDGDASTRGQDPLLTKIMACSLRVLGNVATFAKENEADVSLPSEVTDKEKGTIISLGKLCVGSENGAIAKAAAKCLVTLFPRSSNAYNQLSQTLMGKLSVVVASGKLTPQVVSNIKTFSVLNANVPDAIMMATDQIVTDIHSILELALNAHTAEEDDVDEKAKHSLVAFPCLNAEVVDASAKALVRYALSLAGATAAVVVPKLFNTLKTAIQQTAAFSGTMGGAKKRLALEKQLLRLLLHGEACLTSEIPLPTPDATDSTTSGKKGKASKKGESKAATVTISSNDAVPPGLIDLIAKEITVATLISSEDSDEVRHVCQGKIRSHMLRGYGDTRHLAMLILSALSEQSRNGYTDVRDKVSDIADRMRHAQQTQNIALSDPAARRCYLEYVVPTLVLYQAHHPFYTAERTGVEVEDEGEERGESEQRGHQGPHSAMNTPFRNFTRCWQLLFNEIFRFDTQSTSALQEMFRRLRSLDDGVPNAAEDVASRVICDLAAKTMLVVLGEKNVGSASPFPGSLLIPRYFVRPTDPQRFPAETVFLPQDVVVTAHPLFGGPVGQITGSAVKGGPSLTPGGRRGTSHSMAQGSVPPYRDADDEEAEMKPRGRSAAKRSRAQREVEENAEIFDDFETVPGQSPQPKQTAPREKKGRTNSPARRKLRMEDPPSTASSVPRAGAPPEAPELPPEPAGLITSEECHAIFAAVYDLCASLTPKEFASPKFKVVKDHVSAALGKECTPEIRAYIRTCTGAVAALIEAQI